MWMLSRRVTKLGGAMSMWIQLSEWEVIWLRNNNTFSFSLVVVSIRPYRVSPCVPVPYLCIIPFVFVSVSLVSSNLIPRPKKIDH